MTQSKAETIQNAVKPTHQLLKEQGIDVALLSRLTKQLNTHEKRLAGLDAQVKQLSWENRRGGGFPWGLMLLVGAGYALYRARPDLLAQVKGLLGQADPGVQGNLNRAGADLETGVHAGLQGRDPSSAGQAAVGEVKRAGQKVGDAAHDQMEALKTKEA